MEVVGEQDEIPFSAGKLPVCLEVNYCGVAGCCGFGQKCAVGGFVGLGIWVCASHRLRLNNARSRFDDTVDPSSTGHSRGKVFFCRIFWSVISVICNFCCCRH
jgi:hypothetical protein